MACELCLNALPLSIQSKGKPIDLFSVEKPEAPYIILEALSKDANSKGLHVISLTNKFSVRLGRGHESDVRISDISVSRCHAIIKFQEGRFILDDNNSKFGTLVEITGPIAINPEIPLEVQIGRTVISFHNSL